jgi:hypothetical protein
MSCSKHLVPIVALIAALGAAPVSAGTAASEEASVLAVMDRFDSAIREHDAAALKNLFYNGEIIWKLTLSPAQVERLEKKFKEIGPVTDRFGGYRLLDDERFKLTPIAERFYNPQVVTDGQVATLMFDYDFTMNCKPLNWGKETWQLVKTDAGWKILNLLYSGYELADGPIPVRHSAPVAGCTPVQK